MDNSLSYNSEIKKGLINLLMFTLYSDEKTIYREYVQNALDSINKAIDERVLAQAKDGVVKIYIDERKKTIVIKDNGTGINANDAVRTLLDISASTKDGVNQAGQFGIGRLVGGGYCHELIFRTTARGESIGTQITFDVDKIWHMVKEDPTEYLATYVIDVCTTKEHFDVDEGEHFFEVTLNDVKSDSAPALLNREEVVEYLNMVAPVGYKPHFNNVLIYKSTVDNPEFRALHEGLKKVQLFVDKTPIQKQYELSIKGTKDEINNLEYFKIEDETFGMLGWGWFALTKFTIQIPKDDSLACIRLRKHNIQIGDQNLLSGGSLWKEERGNSYFYGEFFVTHANIVPNGARDGLAPTPETNALYAKLREYFESLKNLYTKANEAKKSIDKIKEGIERWNKTKNLNDYNAKDLIDNKGISKFDKLVKNATFAPTQRMLMLYQPAYEKAKKDAEETKKALTPKPLTPPPPVIEQDEPEETSTFVSENPAGEVTTTNEPLVENHLQNDSPTSSELPHPNVIETTPVTPTVETLALVPTTTPLLGQQDIIAPLEAMLDKNEVWIIRRVFNVLNTYCPQNEHDQKLVFQMKRLIVKEFSNGN
ncbi:MAG: ATP-binding protein [Bacteroidales bacterium]|nr:ATP-binding protein [Bacteroidales bacterium]